MKTQVSKKSRQTKKEAIFAGLRVIINHPSHISGRSWRDWIKNHPKKRGNNENRS